MAHGTDLERRLAIVDRVLADPPMCHHMTPAGRAAGELGGVWATDRSCYELLAHVCHEGTRSLETGSGVSTVLFAAWGCRHHCITPVQEEVDALLDYCRSHGYPVDGVSFDQAFYRLDERRSARQISTDSLRRGQRRARAILRRGRTRRMAEAIDRMVARHRERALAARLQAVSEVDVSPSDPRA